MIGILAVRGLSYAYWIRKYHRRDQVLAMDVEGIYEESEMLYNFVANLNRKCFSS